MIFDYQDEVLQTRFARWPKRNSYHIHPCEHGWMLMCSAWLNSYHCTANVADMAKISGDNPTFAPFRRLWTGVGFTILVAWKKG